MPVVPKLTNTRLPARPFSFERLMLALAPLTGSGNAAPKRRAAPSYSSRVLSRLQAARYVICLTLLLIPLAGAVAQQPVIVRLAAIAGPSEPLPPPGPLAIQPAPLPSSLTLADLEQIALSNNPSLGRAQALVTAARGNWVQVGL